MNLAQYVVAKFKLEKQREEEITTYVNPKSCNYISWNKPKKGEIWTPEEVKEEGETKKQTTRKATAKKASTKKTTTTKKTTKRASTKKIM